NNSFIPEPSTPPTTKFSQTQLLLVGRPGGTRCFPIIGTSSFLRRQRGIPKHFSRERFNIKGVNSIRFNGLSTSDSKDIVEAMKKQGELFDLFVFWLTCNFRTIY
uniref:Uncharacterized protein n=1 Tax=Wuchereria bancrofti TaxID=6293 RepID=A0A1I8ENT3_WUCBA